MALGHLARARAKNPETRAAELDVPIVVASAPVSKSRALMGPPTAAVVTPLPQEE